MSGSALAGFLCEGGKRGRSGDLAGALVGRRATDLCPGAARAGGS